MPIIGCKDIRKDCPRCGCSRDKIEYWNCGPIVYICCPNCRYRLDESIDTPIGIDKLFSAWNGELWKYRPIKKEIFHVHTKRCKHAEDVEDEAYVKKAIELGATRIVFTDHSPFPGNPFGNRMDYEELPEYIDAMQSLKNKYKHQIEILCGLEVEYLPSYDAYIKELKELGDFDVLILGQHMYELIDRPLHWSFELADKSNEHEFLAEAMINGINTGYFDVVAHPDRIFRRCKDWTETCNHIAYEIGVSAARASMPLERNFSSMQRKKQYREEFWDKIQDSMLAVDGIDAHSINEIEDWVKQNKGW